MKVSKVSVFRNGDLRTENEETTLQESTSAIPIDHDGRLSIRSRRIDEPAESIRGVSKRAPRNAVQPVERFHRWLILRVPACGWERGRSRGRRPSVESVGHRGCLSGRWRRRPTSSRRGVSSCRRRGRRPLCVESGSRGRSGDRRRGPPPLIR